ncbi:unnamed protein product [Aspergillus oryzae var. brunneus]|uniref:Unnamed protein product n=2 Tax=Aspergillus oryzae TaxID=5062 RepID=A0AAN4YV67_ASPOZ|nr:unnamed protein product [Aspergillus oryzae]GMG34897.1 unnamed protein product [Aspergillus oryzae]GMG52490.1 unnamed protein product [Aspergillus oryzae var. brunneus]
MSRRKSFPPLKTVQNDLKLPADQSRTWLDQSGGLEGATQVNAIREPKYDNEWPHWQSSPTYTTTWGYNSPVNQIRISSHAHVLRQGGMLATLFASLLLVACILAYCALAEKLTAITMESIPD